MTTTGKKQRKNKGSGVTEVVMVCCGQYSLSGALVISFNLPPPLTAEELRSKKEGELPKVFWQLSVALTLIDGALG